MTEIISTNIKLGIGKIYHALDKYTDGEAKFLVIRETTEQEYINYRNDGQYELSEYYYEISFD